MAYRRKEEMLSDVLDDEQIEELLYMKKIGSTQQEMADHFGVHRNTVYNILKRHQQRKRDQRATNRPS